MTGSASRKPAASEILNEVKNGSVTPSVTSCVFSGSGSMSHSRICSWNGNAIAIPPRSAKKQTNIRERSSSRCSTSVALSPCSRRRGKRAMGVA